jgi:hypothetical protein
MAGGEPAPERLGMGAAARLIAKWLGLWLLVAVGLTLVGKLLGLPLPGLFTPALALVLLWGGAQLRRR